MAEAPLPAKLVTEGGVTLNVTEDQLGFGGPPPPASTPQGEDLRASLSDMTDFEKLSLALGYETLHLALVDGDAVLDFVSRTYDLSPSSMALVFGLLTNLVLFVELFEAATNMEGSTHEYVHQVIDLLQPELEDLLRRAKA